MSPPAAPSRRLADTHVAAAARNHPSTTGRAMDKLAVAWIIAANLLAAGMMYQRLDSLGYLGRVKHAVESVVEHFGLLHAAHPQCGLQEETMFILTSSRVVHPDGVRPGASECCERGGTSGVGGGCRASTWPCAALLRLSCLGCTLAHSTCASAPAARLSAHRTAVHTR